jgi:hypothetical protein
MARIWYEGFDNQNNASDIVLGVLSSLTLNGGAFSLVAGRFFGKAMSLTTAADTVGVPALWTKTEAAGSTAFIHLALNLGTPTNGSDATTWVAFVDTAGGHAQASVGIDGLTGAVTLYQGYGPAMANAAGDGLLVLAASAAGAVPIGAFCSLEIGLVIGTGLTGSLTAKVNGAVVVQATAVSTQQTANASFTALQGGVTLSSDGTTGSTATSIFDDAYWGDATGSSFNSYSTPITVFSRFATANSSVSFVPKSGTNFSQISETAMDGSATYNYQNAVGDQDSFSSTQALPVGYAPLSVKVQVAAASDMGTTRHIETTLISGTATVNGASALAALSFGYSETYADQDPAISGAWTAASVNASLFGYKQSA